MVSIETAIPQSIECSWQVAGSGGCRGGLSEEMLGLPHARHSWLQMAPRDLSQGSWAPQLIVKKEQNVLDREMRRGKSVRNFSADAKARE